MVPQKSRELAATAPLRRRMRRIADARPVTDAVVERFIMVLFACAFWSAVIAVGAIGCAAGVSLRRPNHGPNDGVLRCLRVGAGAYVRRSNRVVASDWLPT